MASISAWRYQLMSSQPGDVGKETNQSAKSEGASQSSSETAPASHICSVCQQPIEREGLQRWRGELIHEKCKVELRCGISVGERPER